MGFFTQQGWALLLTVMLVAGAVSVSYGDNSSDLVGHWVYVDGRYNDDCLLFGSMQGNVVFGERYVKWNDIELFSDGTGFIGGDYFSWKVAHGRLILVLGGLGSVAVKYKVSAYELFFYCKADDDDFLTYMRKEKVGEYKKKQEEEEMRLVAEEKKKEEEKKRRIAEETRRVEEEKKKEIERELDKITSYFTDSRDGQKYRAVKIGGKTWMAKNLNYQAGKSWCYDGDNSNCEKYGRLYDWNTAKKACPSGWHLPSNQEWDDLVAAAGGKVAGKKLKSADGWGEPGNGSDDYRFSALPGGWRSVSDGTFFAGGLRGWIGHWWTATANYGGHAYYRKMVPGEDNVEEKEWGKKGEGYSVRCVADK